MRRFLSAALVALTASIMLTAVPASASDNSTYMTVYNSINSVYTSLQKIAGAHDSWVKSHASSCAHDQSNQWWAKKYPKDVKAVDAAEKKLKTARHKHKKTYSDFVKTFTDLVHFMNNKIEPRLISCQTMPKKSQAVSADLQTIQNDLGIINYN